ncbi:tetratricopeptide repeat protein [Kitasatospora camelliae]|uniref:Tetratricopeptide repeat protein n=1 Tax=Kitasatospora camelliae TaxID=3156397 RepID=A0AAU8K3M2_9ACTN
MTEHTGPATGSGTAGGPATGSGTAGGPATGSGAVGSADAAVALGTRLEAVGEHARAEEALRHAVRIYEAAYGPDDRRLALPLNALGTACAARGRLAEAERLLTRSLALLARDRAEEET